MPFASRFVVGSVDELVAMARGAIPAVAVGERAEINAQHRTVVLECVGVDPFVEWREVDVVPREVAPCTR